MKAYLLDEDQLRRLQSIQARLHGGNDKERDEGHKLWLVLNAVKETEHELPE